MQNPSLLKAKRFLVALGCASAFSGCMVHTDSIRKDSALPASVPQTTDREQKIAALIETLTSGGYSERKNAIKALANIGDPAVPALVNMLNPNPNPFDYSYKERLAALALGEIAGNNPQNVDVVKAVPVLVNTFRNIENAIWLRQRSAEVLGNFKDERTISELIHAMDYTQLDISYKSSDGHHAYEAGITSTVQAALVKIGKPAAPALFERVKRGSGTAILALERIKDPSVRETLVSTLLHIVKNSGNEQDWSWKPWHGRAYDAYRALGRIAKKNHGKPDGDEILPALLEGLKDKSMRTAAAQALGVAGDERALGALIEGLKDDDYHFQMEMVWALREIRSVKALPALVEAYQVSNLCVRVEIAHALGLLGSGCALGTLIEATGDGNPILRAVAAESLGMIGDPRALPVLQIMSESDPNQGIEVRGTARDAIDEIKKKMRQSSCIPSIDI